MSESYRPVRDEEVKLDISDEARLIYEGAVRLYYTPGLDVGRDAAITISASLLDMAVKETAHRVAQRVAEETKRRMGY